MPDQKKGKNTDWVAIVLSSIAILLSCITFYFQYLKSSPNLKYHQSWAIHRDPSLSELGESSWAYKLWNSLHIDVAPTIFMIYTITLSNDGNKLTSDIMLTLANLEAINVTDKRWCGLTWPYPCLWLEPTTHQAPVYNNDILQISQIGPYSYITIRILSIIPRGKERLKLTDVPYIQNVDNNKYGAVSANVKPFEEGSIEDLVKRLSNDILSELKTIKYLKKSSER